MPSFSMRALTAPNWLLRRPNNILEWHFVIKGPKDTPYAGGAYHGKLIFPSEYPYKPPAIMMLTPKCVRARIYAQSCATARLRAASRHCRTFFPVSLSHTHTHTHPLCLSPVPSASPLFRLLSGRFNTNTRLCLSMSDFHPETWVPAWSVASILNGVLSFMLESTPTVGSVEASTAERRKLAIASHGYNRKTPIFCELFPQLVEETAEQAAMVAEGAQADGADAAGGDGGGMAGGGNERGGFSLLCVGMALALAAAVGVGYIGRDI